MLKSGGTPDETVLKIYLQPEDTIYTINERIQAAIAKNSEATYENKTDKFVSFLFAVPGLVRFVVWLARNLDKIGLLPRFVIDLSPFHTSLFITNLASIKTSFIHHHCYEFGTTSVFVCMGKPVPGYAAANMDKKMMPLGVVMDERICTGYEYATFCNDFRYYLRHPEELELPFDGSVDEVADEEKDPVGV